MPFAIPATAVISSTLVSLYPLSANSSIDLSNIKEEIKGLYNAIDEVDNDIKYKKEQIKKMEIKIKEVKEAAESFMSSLHYVTIKSKNSIVNKIKSVFVKEQLKLNA